MRQAFSLFAAAIFIVASPWNVDAQGIISTVAGGGPANGPALATPLGSPGGIALDAAGNVFIAAQLLNRVIKVDAGGQATTVAGNSAFGFSGDGGLATAATLASPSGVTVDGAGNLYIADQSNQRIRRVDAATGIITTVAGNGTFGFSGDGGAAVTASLANPASVAVDSAGNLFIADLSNHRVRKVDAITEVITTVAGSDRVPGFSGDLGLATSARLANPSGVDVDGAGNLFIADRSNHRVRKVDALGVITTFAGSDNVPGFSGDGGLATSARLANPSDVGVDGAGNVFIADLSNQRVRKVDAAGVITTVAGNGTFGFSGDGGLATSARLASPASVAVHSNGTLYFADLSNQRIRRVAGTDGVITTVAGNGTSRFSGDGGSATAASLADPIDVAVDSVGNIFIVDASNHRVRKVDAATRAITTVAGNGIEGFSGEGGLATGASLHDPSGVAVDSAGNLFIADLTNQRIRRVDATTGIITTVAGNGTRDFSGDGAPATGASLKDPSGVAVDSAGNIFIADTVNQRIRKVAATTGVITTVAGSTIVAGSDALPGFSGDGGPATTARLANPIGVDVDNAGNLFIADLSNQRVRKVDAATGIITTVAGNGARGFSGDGGAATSASLQDPVGVAVDNAGNLFIADLTNQRVRRVDAASGVITTVAGNGSSGFSGDGGPATSAALTNPSGVAVDSTGSLFIADSLNQRIRRVAAPDLVQTSVTNPPPTATRGTTFSVTDTVRNRGGASSPPTATRYYLSVDRLRNAGDKLLTGSRAVPPLLPNATSTGTVARVTIPTNTAFGKYFLLACADDALRVPENNETNNCVASAAVVELGPDLVEIAVTNPPATAIRGTRFSVTDTVRNRGSVLAPASTTRYYLSLDKLRNVGDQRLTGTRTVPALPPGANSPGTVMVTIPTNTVLGTYFLLACADDLAPQLGESNETNNCFASVTAVRVGPDLVETAVTNPPATATRGARFAVTDTVRNVGGGTAPASTTRYYLSVDKLRSASDQPLTGTRAVPALAPNAISRATVTVTIPTTTAFGTYFLLACADSAAQAAESNETNNCLASVTAVRVVGPDLVESAVTNPPATARRGTGFAVTDTVVNRGGAPALASTTRYYLSLDRLRNAGDVLLTGTRAVPALGPSATSRAAVTVTIPPNTLARTYFLLACADDVPRVAETTETNNCLASAGTIIVRP
jgi:subtilase family serine protease/sugar lactone lactonase YvrE